MIVGKKQGDGIWKLFVGMFIASLIVYIPIGLAMFGEVLASDDVFSRWNAVPLFVVALWAMRYFARNAHADDPYSFCFLFGIMISLWNLIGVAAFIQSPADGMRFSLVLSVSWGGLVSTVACTCSWSSNMKAIGHFLLGAGLSAIVLGTAVCGLPYAVAGSILYVLSMAIGLIFTQGVFFLLVRLWRLSFA